MRDKRSLEAPWVGFCQRCARPDFVQSSLAYSRAQEVPLLEAEAHYPSSPPAKARRDTQMQLGFLWQRRFAPLWSQRPWIPRRGEYRWGRSVRRTARAAIALIKSQLGGGRPAKATSKSREAMALQLRNTQARYTGACSEEPYEQRTSVQSLRHEAPVLFC